MGKGSGECARPALTLGATTGPTGTVGTPRTAREWSECDDVAVLEAALARTRGVDHWVVQEALRRARGGRAREYGWGSFSWEDLEASALARPGQLHPFFTLGGLARDGVVYVESHRPRRPGSAVQYPLSKDIDVSDYDFLPAELRPPSDAVERFDLGGSHGMSDAARVQILWTKMLQNITDNHPVCAGPKPTLDDLVAHADAQDRGPWSRLSEDERRRILEHMVALASGTATTGTPIKRWDYVGDATWRVEADVPVGDEDALVEAMLAAGARVEDREIEVPEYESVHDVQGGKAYHLQIAGGHVEYVPHHSVGVGTVVRTEHRVSWHPTPAQIETLLAKTEAHYASKMHLADEMVSRVREYPDGTVKAARILPTSALKSDRLEEISAAIESGEAIETSIGSKSWKERYSRPTDEEVEASGVFNRVGDRWIFKKQDEPRQAQLEAIRGMDREWQWSFDRDDADGAPRFHASPEGDAEERSARAWRALEERVRHTAKSEGWPPGVLRTMTDADGRLQDSVRARRRSVSRREDVPHDAPMSERGIVRVIGAEPRAAARELRRLGVVAAVERDVPWGLVYEDGPRRGRVIPFLDEYAAGERPLSPPDSATVIHGMTGVRNERQAIERFALMVDSGGLKSIAERRRLGLASANSLSPRGDIASGIDRGVPCKIGDTPSFGDGYVVFGMKPDVLARRDCWYSNTDFGGGHNRYDQYNSYAAAIGQGKMHLPPSDAARQKHYSEGLDEDNEAYFKDEIPWHHVDTVYARRGACYDAIKAFVDGRAASGDLPRSLRVRYYDGSDLSAALAERARTTVKASIWTADEASSS